MTEENRTDTPIEGVWSGLKGRPRSLNPKWFYDARGSALFDAITHQPEYYLTRCEREILEQQGADVTRWIGPDMVLAELGPGNGEKAVLLLRQLRRPSAYVPIDISPASLEAAVDGMRQALPGIRVEALCRDFAEGVDWPQYLTSEPRCLAFFGSTIGNMEPKAAARWLAQLRARLRPGEKMLLGVDLKKDPQLLHAAYNDAAGVTAAFNLNALSHLNHAIGTDFNPDWFIHQAGYNPDQGRVEMYLQATCDQVVHVGQHVLRLERGERIHTENSYKYTLEELRRLTESAGFATDRVWLDRQRWFSLHGLRA